MPQGIVRLSGVLWPPIAVLLAAVWLQSQLDLLQSAYRLLVPYLPYAVLGLGLALSWGFNQSRVFFALALLLLIYWGVHSGLPRPSADVASGEAVPDAVRLLIPLSFAVISLLNERGIFTWRGIVRLVALLVPAAVVVLLVSSGGAHPAPGWWPAELWHPQPLASTPSAIATALLFVVAGLLLVRLACRPTVTDGALLGALAAGAMALRDGSEPLSMALFVTAAGLLLVTGIVQDGYRKAYVDELTGLPGRRALEEELLKLSGRYTMAMLDVDHFKSFNDAYGHQVGDQVLRMVASQLHRVSGGGRPFRYGGEEFSILFSGKSAGKALPHLQKLRAHIAESPFVVRRRRRGPELRGLGSSAPRASITVSIGVAERDRRHATAAAVLKAADRALYRAKRSGRNRVCA